MLTSSFRNIGGLKSNLLQTEYGEAKRSYRPPKEATDEQPLAFGI